MPTTDQGANACQTSSLKHAIPYDMQRSPGADSDNYWAEDWTPTNVNLSFVARVAWDQSDLFLADMLGSHQRIGNKIRRVNPEPHPYYPSFYCIGCKDLRNLGPHGYDASHNNAIKYQSVEYLCTFAAFLYAIAEDHDVDVAPNGELIRYVERHDKQVGQSVQANGVTFEYVTPPNAALPTPPAIHVPYRTLEYVWHYVPSPIGALSALADRLYGTVNATTFDAGGQGADDPGYPPGTLMFLGMQKTPIVSTPAMNALWRLTFSWAYFQHGWNSVYRASGGLIYTDAAGNPNTAWDAARTRGTATPPYLGAEHLDLFRT